MTPPLLQLQAEFQQHLLHGDARFAAAVRDGGIGVARRLHVYHHAYRARLAEALRDTFDHTARYLGPDWFDAAAHEFVESHPSTQANLNGYGAGFAAWLHERHPQDPDIGELATLDWALRRAFDGPDAQPLALADLARIEADAWARIGFALVPTCSQVVTGCNTLAIWHALDQDEVPPPAAPLPEPATVLVWRRGHQPHFRSLDAFERVAVDGLFEGLSFAALCARLAERFAQADVAREAGTLLQRWLDQGLLAAVRDPAAA